MSKLAAIPDRTSSNFSPPQSLSPVVLAYLKSIASNNRPLSTKQLQEFQLHLSATHHASVSTPAGATMETLGNETPKAPPSSSVLDMKQFLNYMISSEGNASETPTEQDLTYPISNYFINSSHNTYLTGNQLYSDSSTDAYKNVCTAIYQLNGLSEEGGQKADQWELYTGSSSRLSLY